MKILPEVDANNELESLALSKRSRGTVSTASLSKTSSMKSKSKHKQNKKTNKDSKQKKKERKKPKRSSKGSKRLKKSSKHTMKTGSSKKASSTVWKNPPKEVSDYLESIFQASFNSFSAGSSKTKDFELIEICVTFGNARTKKGKTKKNKKSKKGKKSKKRDGERERAKKRSRRTSKRKQQKGKSESTDFEELPSSFYKKRLQCVEELVSVDNDNDPSGEDLRSASGMSNDTPRVRNMHDFGHNGDHIDLLQTESPPSSKPRLSSVDGETRSMRPPLRPSISDDEQDELSLDEKREEKERRNSKKNRRKAKRFRKIAKKTLKKAIPSSKIFSKKKKKGDKKKRKEKRKSSRLSKKVSWKQLKETGSSENEDDDDEDDEDLAWAREAYLETPKKRKKKVSLGSWGVGDEQEEPSETSDYGMSTYSGMREAQLQENEDSSSSSDGSVYIGRERDWHDSEDTNGISNFSSGSDEIEEEEYYSSEANGSLYEEESWDEEEEYVSPDEDDYVSPDEQNLQDAADYVSPFLSATSSNLIHARDGLSHSMIEDGVELPFGLEDGSEQSSYEEVVLTDDDVSSDSSRSIGSSSSASTSSSYDSRQRM